MAAATGLAAALGKGLVSTSTSVPCLRNLFTFVLLCRVYINVYKNFFYYTILFCTWVRHQARALDQLAMDLMDMARYLDMDPHLHLRDTDQDMDQHMDRHMDKDQEALKATATQDMDKDTDQDMDQDMDQETKAPATTASATTTEHKHKSSGNKTTINTHG